MRYKKEWTCSSCGFKYPKWENPCRQCGAVLTLSETVLVPTAKRVSRETPEARRIRLRAKKSEREIARRMVRVDGPDPMFVNIASSTGRVGHISGLQIDAVSKGYVTENKNRVMPSWLVKAYLQINQKAREFNKNALLHIEPPNMPKEYLSQGHKVKLDTMAIITQTRHEDLIRSEQMLSKVIEMLKGHPEIPLEELQDIFTPHLNN